MKKYIESHWLAFAAEGLIAFAFGLVIIFTDITNRSYLALAIGVALLIIGIISLFNSTLRKNRQHNWGLALTAALLETATGAALIITRDLPVATTLTILAVFTILRGFLEILIGFRSISNKLDRVLWVITGMFGVILGFTVLNAGSPDPNSTLFIKIFAGYLLLSGIANLVYSFHWRTLLRLSPKKKK